MRDYNVLRSFRFAFCGLRYVLQTEQNIYIHLGVTGAVILLGVWLDLSFDQWAVLILTISFVLVNELVNTALEAAIDLISPEYDPLARIAKDVMAGAVLLAAITSIVVGLLVLGPPLWSKLMRLSLP
jgi:diacylglycerol kinase